MERDGLAPTLIMTTGLQRPKVPQAATDAYAVTRERTARSSRNRGNLSSLTPEHRPHNEGLAPLFTLQYHFRR
jgi:hypothetical protein